MAGQTTLQCRVCVCMCVYSYTRPILTEVGFHGFASPSRLPQALGLDVYANTSVPNTTHMHTCAQACGVTRVPTPPLEGLCCRTAAPRLAALKAWETSRILTALAALEFPPRCCPDLSTALCPSSLLRRGLLSVLEGAHPFQTQSQPRLQRGVRALGAHMPILSSGITDTQTEQENCCGTSDSFCFKRQRLKKN